MLLVTAMVCDASMLRCFVAMVTKQKCSGFAQKECGGPNFFSPGSPKILTVFCFIYSDSLLIRIIEPITLMIISGLKIGLLQIFVKRH